MDAAGKEIAKDGAIRLRICWILGLVWLVCYLGSLLLSGSTAGAMLGGLQTLIVILVVLVHSSLLYGWKGTALYLVLGSLIGFALEASSVATGFPFGSYVHNVSGPKPMGVPIAAIVVYAVAGWYAWVIGKAIVLNRPARNAGIGLIAVPLVAAIVLAGLDYPMDPIGATIRGDWTFKYPSGQFGVPISNYLGWIFTGWVLFQLFSFIERRLPVTSAAADPRFWLLPCLMWLLMPLQLVPSWLNAPEGTVSVADRTFVIGDIQEAALIASIFSMLLPALIAISRLISSRADTN